MVLKGGQGEVLGWREGVEGVMAMGGILSCGWGVRA